MKMIKIIKIAIANRFLLQDMQRWTDQKMLPRIMFKHRKLTIRTSEIGIFIALMWMQSLLEKTMFQMKIKRCMSLMEE